MQRRAKETFAANFVENADGQLVVDAAVIRREKSISCSSLTTPNEVIVIEDSEASFQSCLISDEGTRNNIDDDDALENFGTPCQPSYVSKLRETFLVGSSSDKNEFAVNNINKEQSIFEQPLF